jgi:hypothetical protein
MPAAALMLTRLDNGHASSFAVTSVKAARLSPVTTPSTVSKLLPQVSMR